MKKFLMSMICICLCALFLALCCYATMPPFYPYDCESHDEYKKILQKDPPPDGFVTYDRLAFLGKLEHFRALEDYDGYTYTIIAKNSEKIYLSFNQSPFSLYAQFVSALKFTKLADETNMVQLDTAAIEKRLGIDLDSDQHMYYIKMTTDEGTYYYNYTGKLIYIRLYSNGEFCYISTDFSKCEPDSLIGKLLNRDTAPTAAAEIKARAAGFYEESWKRPLTICVSVICSAAVTAVVTWLATFLVMRKRAKNPHRFGGNETGESASDTEISDDNAPPKDTTPKGTSPAP